MDYLFLLGAAILIAFEFALAKVYQAKAGTSLAAGLRFNILSGAATAVLFFALNGFRMEFSWFSLWMAFGFSACLTAYSLLGFRVLKQGNVAIYSIFLMSGGMLLPYFFGLYFLDEMINPYRVVGIMLLLGAIILSNYSKGKISVRLVVLCFAIFLLNGFVSIFSKCHQVGLRYRPVSSTAFVFYCAVTKILLSSIALVFADRKQFPFQRNTLWVIGAVAAVSGVSFLLQLLGARNLPATVQYPLVSGGAIIFSALAGRVFFREKLSLLQIIGIALCLLSTLLFL